MSIFLSTMMEYIKALNLYVDWEKGKLYRKKEKGFLDNLLGIFGKTQEESDYEEVSSPELERKVKSYKLYELYILAKKAGKTEFKENLNGQEVAVKIEPQKVTVETPSVVMEYTPDKFVLKDKNSGQVQEKVPTLQEFYQMYKEIRKLLAAGNIEQYLSLKAREPQFKQAYLQNESIASGQSPSGGGFSWGSALLGLGGGLLLGYLLGSALGSAFAEEVQNAPELPPEEQSQIEEQVSTVPEEVVQEVEKTVAVEDVGSEGLPTEEFSDMDTPEGGDYFTQLDEEVLDGEKGLFAEADGFGGEEDLGGFDDMGGDDFEV